MELPALHVPVDMPAWRLTMISRSRSIVFCTAVLAVVGLLDSCDGGGTERIYISMSNYEGCVTAFARLNLDGTDAELARKPDGTVDCTLSPELVSAGCTLSIEEDNEFGDLRAIV